jgi:hypothetical protein
VKFSAHKMMNSAIWQCFTPEKFYYVYMVSIGTPIKSEDYGEDVIQIDIKANFGE